MLFVFDQHFLLSFLSSLRERLHLACPFLTSVTPSWAVEFWDWLLPWPIPESFCLCKYASQTVLLWISWWSSEYLLPQSNKNKPKLFVIWIQVSSCIILQIYTQIFAKLSTFHLLEYFIETNCFCSETFPHNFSICLYFVFYFCFVRQKLKFSSALQSIK